MANNKKGPLIIACSSHPQLAAAICEKDRFQLLTAKTVRFANGNMQVQIPISVRDRDVFVVQTQVDPTQPNIVDHHIVELMFTIDALEGASVGRITAVLPMFPYARGDKKDKPRISIAARTMAVMLEAVGVNRVLVVDLHSPQIEGFFRPNITKVDKLSGVPLLADYLKQRDLTAHVILAADVGEAKDAGRYARRLRLPLAIIDKRRMADDDTAKAVNLIGEVSNQHVIIVDDEIATAGTIMEAIDFAINQGALDVLVAATHGVLCGPAIDRINNNPHIKEVIVTDTVPQDEHRARCSKLTVLPTSVLLAQAIRRIHVSESVSVLLE